MSPEPLAPADVPTDLPPPRAGESAPAAVEAHAGKPTSPSMGFGRLPGALRYSIAGLRHAAGHEAAFRQELAALVVLVPAALALPVSVLEQLLLVLSMLLVLVVELLNSAVEATVDRISADHHPLSGRAKDLGSAAVAVALLMSALCWLAIAGPLLVAWLRELQ
jgi:diacylglycerol kinase (ATP)